MENNRVDPMLPDAGMCGCDREIFERVWRRVMPEGMEDSPIQLLPAQTQTEVQPQQTELAVPDSVTERISEESSGPDVVYLGQGSVMYAALLQEMIDGETEDWRFYQALARRTNGGGARTLGTMAADERRHARKLSTAYFLITGERYQPRGQGGSRPAPELMTGLREQFIQEQREVAAYQGAAAESADSCLRQLFRELAQEEEMHARMIRNLLEQM